MSEDTLITTFINVFRGRGDVYGSAKGFCIHEKLTRRVFEQHLTSPDPDDWIGVYCMVGDKCSWGAVDIDGKDFPLHDGSGHDWGRMAELAKKLVAVLGARRVPAFIERTKNGYHVWVFPQEPLVPARTMRRALQAACAAINYDPKEVNPKAEGPRKGTKGYGNFVRLPYGGALAEPMVDNPRRMLGPTSPWALNEFLHNVERAPTAYLDAIARLYIPPPEPRTTVDLEAGLDAEPILKMAGGLAYTIWKNGPYDDGIEHGDRSGALWKLANQLHDDGVPANGALTVLASADLRWGKYQDQGRPEELTKIIERIYG